MDALNLIKKGVQFYGRKIAVIDKKVRFSFIEIDERSTRLARGLLDRDVKKGDKVVGIFKNCHQYIETLFAKYKIGVVDVSLNPRLDSLNTSIQINDCQANTVIFDESVYDKIIEIRSELKQVKNFISIGKVQDDIIPYEELISTSKPEIPPIGVKGEDLCRIQYTTGSTGNPKGIMIPLKSDIIVLSNLLIDNIPTLCDKDIFLGVQPIYHAVRAFILPCWIKGATHVLVSDYSPETVFDIVEKEKVSIIKTVPTLLNRMVSHPDIKKRDLKSIRTIIYGAAPMAIEQLQKAMEIFGPIFIQNYGQTEVPTTICCLGKEDHDIKDDPNKRKRLFSVGRPYTHVEVRIVDEAGNNVSPGELGEIIVQSDHAMIGYWNLPKSLTEGTLKNGWVYTGDIGRMDEKGYIFLVDRKGEMIISGGYNIYPSQVEQVLYKHPAVIEAAIIGVPDQNWGEAVKAVIAIKSGMKATEKEIINFCKEYLPSFMKPQTVEFWDSLPKNPEGKILRRKIREKYWAGRERRIS